MPTLILILVALLGTAVSADALLVMLTDAQVQEAIAHGKQTFEQWKKGGPPIDDLDPPYIVDLGKDVGRAGLYTEFSSVALETRRHLAIGREFPRDDIENLLARFRGKIELYVVVIVPDRDHLLTSTVRLADRRTEHRALTENVGRGLTMRGVTGRFVASGRYTFDARNLDATGPVTLVIVTPAGDRIRFTFDLSRIK